VDRHREHHQWKIHISPEKFECPFDRRQTLFQILSAEFCDKTSEIRFLIDIDDRR
jgi:hypothetical protein